MRTILLTAAAAFALSGCAGTKASQRPAPPARTSHAAPVVSESPRLSERFRVNRQQEAERATLNDTEISGNVVR